jgi:DnaJ-domain-containing protein 1
MKGSSMSSHQKINELIEATEDPVQRAVLLVLANIARDLDNNTIATQRIAEAFDNHREDFQRHDIAEAKDRAYIRGAWWAGVIFVSLMQTVGGWIIWRGVTSNDTQDTVLQQLDKRISVMEARVSAHLELLQRPSQRE